MSKFALAVFAFGLALFLLHPVTPIYWLELALGQVQYEYEKILHGIEWLVVQVLDQFDCMVTKGGK